VFFYKRVLDRPLGSLVGAVRAKAQPHLPVVFTRHEVVAVLNRLDGTVWLVTALLYGSGLRLTEGLRLRVKDIDFERLASMCARARAAKTACRCYRATSSVH
jgi:integrase